jgi:hypothetical protein
MSNQFLTRKQAVELVRSETGIPVTESRLDKEAMLGTAPKPAALYGRRHLYTREAVLGWAQTLIRPIEPAA